jgi:beta-galactosidase
LKVKHFALLLALLLPAIAGRSLAQDVGRVSPAVLPLPLPTETPTPPDVLRAHNPWLLSMTGTWRFALTHGRIVAGEYQPDPSNLRGITASSNEQANPPENAFDGSAKSRWCADGNSFPQWLQADLGVARRVAGITLTWERSNERYRCRIEGSQDGKHWTALADASAAPGLGDGPVSIQSGPARYVRVTVLGSSGTGWASIRECRIDITEGGQTVAWTPPPVKLPSAATRDEFALPAYNDATWDNLAVPSNWEIAGYSPPTYNAVDNTVGQYRRWVNVPAAWGGRRIYWHFDGALDGAEVFVNGQRAGYHESGYTAFDVDLTGLVKPGQRNLFAVRVSKSTPSDDCETGDFQAMGGIYRETSLIAVPETHIHDITVRTPLDTNYQDATLTALVQVQGKPGENVAVTGTLFGADGRPAAVQLTGQGQIEASGATTFTLSAPVKAPKLWSAEKPNLYYIVFALTGASKPVARVEQRFGFRQIEIKNNIVLWNGKPIKCTGTCRHDFWADKGFALTDKEWNRDLALIKAANINAIRTSHYNHAARFLELCEEKGVYILDEVPYCWIGDQVKDPKYAPYLLQRATETLARDKNRPCVLAWSIGNENPPGQDSQEVIDLVHGMDPTRPAFVSSVSPNDIKGQSWEDDHYPDPHYVDQVANNGKWPANFSEHPHIFYQKETQDYDPGASDLWSETLIKTWDKLWKDPTILGSFIWEWQNQGIADKYPDKTRDLWYGPDHLRQENNKGIVSAYRVPKPEWWIVKMAYSPVVVETRTVSPAADGTCTVPLLNHYSFTDLKELDCRWTALAGSNPLRSGVLHIACPPWETVQASFPAPAGMTQLRLEFVHPDDTSVTTANLAVAGVPLPAPPAAIAAGNALTIQNGPDMLRVGNSLQEFTFNKQTGAIQSWRVHDRVLLQGGPVLNLGEAKASDEKDFYHARQPPVIDAVQVTTSPEPGRHLAGGVRVTVTGNVLTAVGGSPLGKLTTTYDIQPDAEVRVHWVLDWTSADTHLWEAGLKLAVPTALTQMGWLRDSYFTDYPAGHIGEPAGMCRAGDVLFRATKRGLHWLTLTTATGDGLALLPADTPLVARCESDVKATTLYASEEVAGPRDFSGSWVDEHEIMARKGKSLFGAFTLRAIAR